MKRLAIILLLIAIAAPATAKTLEDFKAEIVAQSRGKLSAESIDVAALDAWIRSAIKARTFAPRIRKLRAQISRTEAEQALAMGEITQARRASVAAINARLTAETKAKRDEAAKAEAKEAAKPASRMKAAKATLDEARKSFDAATKALQKLEKKAFDKARKAKRRRKKKGKK